MHAFVINLHDLYRFSTCIGFDESIHAAIVFLSSKIKGFSLPSFIIVDRHDRFILPITRAVLNMWYIRIELSKGIHALELFQE